MNKKKKAKLLGMLVIIMLICTISTPAHAAPLTVEMSDVWLVVRNCLPYLISFGIVLIGGIIFIIVCKKYDKNKKKILRGQAIIVIIVAFIVVLNAICVGPAKTLLDVVAVSKGEVAEATKEEAKSLITEISEEGAVLLKNNGTLPLSDDKKNLNVFGWSSTNPCYGGTGSGAVDTSSSVSLLDGLKNAGYNLNNTLTDMYTKYRDTRPEAGMSAVDWTLPEPTMNYYSNDIMKEAKEFSDVAVVVIARVGGEGSDLPTDFGAINEDGSAKYTYNNNSTEYDDFTSGQHYLELSQTEKNLIELVSNNFDNIIVICNSANAMELSWVEEDKEIDSVISLPGVGETGFNALGEIIKGNVNPSGKLADTYVYDLAKTPSFNNFGAFKYDNMDEYGWLESNPMTGKEKLNSVNFVNYVESIYVGYKYYETAYEEAQAGNMDFDYDSVVQYPFGYGLSYTTFSQKITEFTKSEDTIDISVSVTNTGNVAGKDVVEIYYNPPYTNSGIEKAAVNLIDFGKTSQIEPGEEETLKFSISIEDMASFDSKENGCYVLEEGNYEISIRSDAHTVLDSKTYNLEEKIIYDESNSRKDDKTAATTQLKFAEGDVEYLSRANGFENYGKVIAAPKNYSMNEEVKKNYLNQSNYDETKYNDDSDKMPTTGKSNGIKLKELRGLDYDDDMWDELLDELSVQDMSKLISGGGYQTAAVESIEKVATTDNDGPATIYNNYTGAAGSAYPSEVLIANTWNKDLAKKMGESIGKEADELDVSGWYAPAMNIHRSAFGGRNFEYYSEDGVLSGIMAAYEIKGAKEYGVYSYIKHFALNDQETNRIYQLCTWADEQAIREIYLKGFEIAVKDGGSGAVMAAHSYIGSEWVGASYKLMTTILRNEWGFKGFVSTDMFAGYGYYDADRAIRAGTDSMLSPMNHKDATVSDTTSATSVIAMRNASHNILYTVVNSRAYADENITYHMSTWMVFMITVDVTVAFILIIVELLLIKKYRVRRKVIEE